MKLTATREDLLAPLQSVIGVVERRQTMPVLANVLLAARDNRLSITGTDLEVELVATSAGERAAGRRHHRSGPQAARYFSRAARENQRHAHAPKASAFRCAAGRSRFTLSSLPAAEFPLVEEINAQQTLTVAQGEFRRLIDKTHFSMAQQDVRYYLNGLLLETDGKALRAVATDGHRLALCEMELARQGQDEPAGHRAAQGRAGAAADPGNRGQHRAGRRNQSRSRPDRRHSLHFEADRWPFPGVRPGHPGKPAADGRGRPGGRCGRRCSAPRSSRTRSTAASA